MQEAVAEIRQRLASDEEYAEAQAALEARINEDVLASSLLARPQRLRDSVAAPWSGDPGEPVEGDDEDNEAGPEVVYTDE